MNPVWNEVFTFDVESGREILKCEVFDRDAYGTDDFEGEFSIGLDELSAQMQHDMWFDLEGNNPSINWKGKVRVVLHYVFSKVKLLTGQINMYNE